MDACGVGVVVDVAGKFLGWGGWKYIHQTIKKSIDNTTAQSVFFSIEITLSPLAQRLPFY
jgi:hypothetical protein